MAPSRFNSLRFRLVAASVLVEVAFLAVLIANAIRLLDTAARANLEAAVVQAVPTLSAAALPYLMQRDYSGLHDFLAVTVDARRGELRYVAVLDRSGQQLAIVGLDTAPPPPNTPEEALQSGVFHLERPIEFASQRLGTLKLGIATDIIAATRRELLNQSLLIAAIEVALSVLLLGAIGILLTRRLERTVDASEAMAAGQFDLRLDDQGGDEVARLARSLNHLGRELGAQIGRLRASENAFRSQFEQAGAGIGHLSRDGSWLRVNRRLEQLLDVSENQVAPLIQLSHPDDLPLADTLADIWEGRLERWQAEGRFRRGNGDWRWCLVTLSPYRADDGEGPITYLTVVLQDLDALKHAEAELNRYRAELEARVAERTQALTAANAELKSFSYTVSHDLRAPLRAIDGFASVLSEDFGDRLDPVGHSYISRIRNAVARMNTLIGALLQLSQANQARIDRRPLNLSLLALSLVDTLRAANPERQVQIDIAPDLEAEGDWTLLGIVLQNLLGNAWKYTSKREQAHIEFGATRQDDETVYFVRDNGAGFDPAYADKLFAPFQRLHSSEEFEGNGVGLATVARIINRHGGRVWASSQPQQGACFYFTLGKNG
ncbi:sensor histidine kinase [Chitinimonas lacunae]|uniref:histidine kinase n=1 Tax=Chitinimonas lacunae TaxID=1963018 RepID=A0ABV8MUS0_9NEIS